MNKYNTDENYIKNLLLIYTPNTMRVLEISEDLLLNAIKRIKLDIKMYQSVPNNKYNDRINYELNNMFTLEYYYIINYGIEGL